MSNGLDTTRLRAWLSSTLGTDEDVTTRLLTGGRSNPTFALTVGSESWILRRPPFGLVLETAHDMGREYRVMAALVDTGVPVPRMIAFCDDSEVIGAPFYLMEKLEGITIGSRAEAESLTPDERSALAETFIRTVAALHSVDPDSVGLGDLGRPDGYLERQLRRWGRQWEQAHSRERPAVHEVLRALEATMPVSDLPGIVHGDVKLDNLMVDAQAPGTALGLLDWEMSTLGDTLADVGLLWAMWDDSSRPHHPLTQGITDLPGFPSADDAVQMYARQRGIEIETIRWYAALADIKLAIILEQIHMRRTASGSSSGVDDVGAMVDPLLDRARESVFALRA